MLNLTTDEILAKGYYKLPVDIDGESPLHHAIRKGDDAVEKEVMELIKNESDITRASKKDETVFHLAKSACVVKLLLDTYRGNIPWKKDINGKHVLQNLLREDERLAEQVMDYFIGKNEVPLNDEELIVWFNLQAFQDQDHKNREFVMEYHKYMIDSGSKLIYHPVALLLMELKWICKSTLVKYLHPFIQIIFTMSLTWMTFCEFDKTEEELSSNVTESKNMVMTCTLDTQELTNPPVCSVSSMYKNMTSNQTMETTEPNGSHCILQAVFTSISLSFLVMFETWQIVRAPIRWLRKSENWLDLFLVLSTTASLTTLLHYDFSKVIKLDTIEASVGLRFFSGMCIFLAWFKIVLLLQRFPKAGRYIRIFKIVSKELLVFLVIYLPVLVAFSTCFFVLMPPKTEAFKNIWTSSLKTFVMLVGELDYDGTFINNEEFEDENVIQILFLQVMSICFLCLVSIVVSNLLTGLAIKEIDKLMVEAWHSDIKEKTDELIEDDEVTKNGRCVCFKDELIKKLEGRSIVCVKPNEVIHKNEHGIFLRFWNFINGREKTYAVFTSTRDPIIDSYGLRYNWVDGSTKDWINYDPKRQDMKKTALNLSSKLIEETMQFLIEKDRPEKSEETSLEDELKMMKKEIKDAHQSIHNNEKMLKELLNHFKINMKPQSPASLDISSVISY